VPALVARAPGSSRSFDLGGLYPVLPDCDLPGIGLAPVWALEVVGEWVGPPPDPS
jgi:hypothetical protein